MGFENLPITSPCPSLLIFCIKTLLSNRSYFQNRMADLLILPNQQLARRIISLSLRTNELSNGIQLSKEHMDKVRGDKARAIRLEKQTVQTRLKEQKSHYEGIVTRHQGFIEQVLAFYIHRAHSIL